jgi:hypothetical protein
MAKQEQEEQVLSAEQVLTIGHVTDRVELIKQIVQEEHPVVASEKAHIEQDKLLKDVLEAIDNGTEDAAGLAGAALEVFRIEFTRWYK